MADGIEIKGLKELQRNLEQLATNKADACIRKALRAGAVVAQTAVKERAPVRPDLPSGTALPPGALASDIVVEVKKAGSGSYHATIGPDTLTERIARWVEYGHRMVVGGYSKVLKNGKRRGPGKELTSVPAHPFIRPAYESSQTEITEAITTTLAKEIEKAAASK